MIRVLVGTFWALITITIGVLVWLVTMHPDWVVAGMPKQ